MNVIIAKRIFELRIERGLTQAEVASAIGVHSSSVGFWESGKYEPKATYIFKLAKFFEVSSDYLLGLTDT